MKAASIKALLLALAFALAGSAQGGRLDPHAYIDKAVALIEDAEHALARAYLDPAVISHLLTPAQRSRAYYLRGYSFYAQGLFRSAAADYSHALEFNPDNPAALYAMASLYRQEFGEDANLAFQLFRKAADLEHPGAQLYVGNAYLVGDGVVADLEEARHWLGRAAEAGFAPAMTRLASSFRRPHTDAPDPAKARHWYERAVQAGATDALVALGFMFRNGELGDWPASVSVDYFKRAAEQGSGPGMANLAHAYLTGSGVATDFALARSWYLKAAQLGASGSFAGLGHIHEAGLGVPVSIEAAKSWYEKGSAAGHSGALLRLLRLLASRGHRAEAAPWAEQAWQRRDARALNAYAWLLATSPVAEIRDGELALRHAHRAVELEPKAAYLDTLAAAYAESGRFEDALAAQRQALALADGDAALIEEFNVRLAAYQQARPWQE